MATPLGPRRVYPRNEVESDSGNWERDEKKKRRKNAHSPSHWLAGAVRILKQSGKKTQTGGGATDTGEESEIVDASSCLSKIRYLEKAIFFLGAKLDGLTTKSDAAAKVFSAATAESLHQNNLTLATLATAASSTLTGMSERIEKLEGRTEEPTLNFAPLEPERLCSLESEMQKLRDYVHIEYPSQSDRLAAAELHLNKLMPSYRNLELGNRVLHDELKGCKKELTKNLGTLETDLKAMSKQVWSQQIQLNEVAAEAHSLSTERAEQPLAAIDAEMREFQEEFESRWKEYTTYYSGRYVEEDRRDGLTFAERMELLESQNKMITRLVASLEASLTSEAPTVDDTIPVQASHDSHKLSKRDEHRVQENIQFALDLLRSQPKRLRSAKIQDFLRLPNDAEPWQIEQKRRMELEFRQLNWIP